MRFRFTTKKGLTLQIFFSYQFHPEVGRFQKYFPTQFCDKALFKGSIFLRPRPPNAWALGSANFIPRDKRCVAFLSLFCHQKFHVKIINGFGQVRRNHGGGISIKQHSFKITLYKCEPASFGQETRLPEVMISLLNYMSEVSFRKMMGTKKDSQVSSQRRISYMST